MCTADITGTFIDLIRTIATLLPCNSIPIAIPTTHAHHLTTLHLYTKASQKTCKSKDKKVSLSNRYPFIRTLEETVLHQDEARMLSDEQIQCSV